MITNHVVVLPYDEQWRQDFLIIKTELANALGQLAIGIEHIGSTSVRGLSAKPIIDIDVVIKDYSVFDDVITALESIGYRHEGDLGIETPKPEGSELSQEALDFIKKTLGDKVDEVIASSRLKSHPVCLSSGDGISFEMERYFKAVGQDMPIKAKRILEINTAHAAFRKIDQLMTTDPDKAGKMAEVLYNQALLIAGLPLDNPSEYTDMIAELMK